MTFRPVLICLMLPALACARLDHLGKPPSFTPQTESVERVAMAYSGPPAIAVPDRPADRASLWSGTKSSLLGDRRAMKTGDILTVVIEINDQASISNSTARSRSGSGGAWCWTGTSTSPERLGALACRSAGS